VTFRPDLYVWRDGEASFSFSPDLPFHELMDTLNEPLFKRNCNTVDEKIDVSEHVLSKSVNPKMLFIRYSMTGAEGCAHQNVQFFRESVDIGASKCIVTLGIEEP
jgi:hypothetical protein